jgi:hypothetical protein
MEALVSWCEAREGTGHHRRDGSLVHVLAKLLLDRRAQRDLLAVLARRLRTSVNEDEVRLTRSMTSHHIALSGSYLNVPCALQRV